MEASYEGGQGPERVVVPYMEWMDLIKGMTFEKIKIVSTNCVLISSKILSETFLILRINDRDMIRNVYWASRKETFILV